MNCFINIHAEKSTRNRSGIADREGGRERRRFGDWMRWFDSIWKILNLEPFSPDNCCCLCCLGWAKTVYCIHENSQTTHYTARMRDEFSATKIVCIHGTVDLIWTNTNFHCLESTVKNQHDSHSIGWSDERECAGKEDLMCLFFGCFFVCVCQTMVRVQRIFG